MRGTVQAFVPYWGDNAPDFAEYVQELCDIPVGIVRGFNHEPKVLNEMIRYCDTDYLWFIHPDDQILDSRTPYTLAEYLDDNPQVGAVLPDVSGEQPYWRKPESWYLKDNTCTMYRMSVGAKFDEDFIFTGWNDIDFGEEIIRRGFEVHLPHNVSVLKNNTSYGSWSSFRSAYNARNRLLLEAKWYWVGIERWGGVAVYNTVCADDRQIPTMFELGWWAEERLNSFADSVMMEHPQILLKDGQGTGNENWRLQE